MPEAISSQMRGVCVITAVSLTCKQVQSSLARARMPRQLHPTQTAWTYLETHPRDDVQLSPPS
jgi:hypothetical protein